MSQLRTIQIITPTNATITFECDPSMFTFFDNYTDDTIYPVGMSDEEINDGITQYHKLIKFMYVYDALNQHELDMISLDDFNELLPKNIASNMFMAWLNIQLHPDIIDLCSFISNKRPIGAHIMLYIYHFQSIKIIDEMVEYAIHNKHTNVLLWILWILNDLQHVTISSSMKVRMLEYMIYTNNITNVKLCFQKLYTVPRMEIIRALDIIKNKLIYSTNKTINNNIIEWIHTTLCNLNFIRFHQGMQRMQWGD